MTIETLTEFFKWCTIINAGFLIYVACFLVFAPDFIYRVQSKWFPISREAFDIVIYSFMGIFKLFFIVFSLVPYIALLIIG